MDADTPPGGTGETSAAWIEVPLRKDGFLGRLGDFIFHFTNLVLCAACVAFLVMVARDKADPAPSCLVQKYLSSPTLPISLLLAAVFAALFCSFQEAIGPLISTVSSARGFCPVKNHAHAATAPSPMSTASDTAQPRCAAGEGIFAEAACAMCGYCFGFTNSNSVLSHAFFPKCHSLALSAGLFPVRPVIFQITCGYGSFLFAGGKNASSAMELTSMISVPLLFGSALMSARKGMRRFGVVKASSSCGMTSMKPLAKWFSAFHS